MKKDKRRVHQMMSNLWTPRQTLKAILTLKPLYRSKRNYCFLMA
jgi:hypothetical protein